MQKNETARAKRGFFFRSQVKKPKGRPMVYAARIANARKSCVRSCVEHVFDHEKGLMGLVVRTIGIARATTKTGLANIAYDIRCFVRLEPKGMVLAAF